MITSPELAVKHLQAAYAVKAGTRTSYDDLADALDEGLINSIADDLGWHVCQQCYAQADYVIVVGDARHCTSCGSSNLQYPTVEQWEMGV